MLHRLLMLEDRAGNRRARKYAQRMGKRIKSQEWEDDASELAASDLRSNNPVDPVIGSDGQVDRRLAQDVLGRKPR